MKFGVLKSKIEKCLIESYNKNTLKDNIFIFNELVKNNKNISKIYYLYDELSSNKGLSESVANDFINGAITIYENALNKINKKDIQEISLWLNNVNTKNEYEKIDNLFSSNVVMLESKIQSRKLVVECLKSNKPFSNNKVISLPLESMVKVANDTITNYLSNVSESEKKEIISLLKEDNDKLEIKFDFIKENTIKRLENILSSDSDPDTVGAIKETIEKVKNESFDKISYIKLKNLNESL
jgi:rubrerythrin